MSEPMPEPSDLPTPPQPVCTCPLDDDSPSHEHGCPALAHIHDPRPAPRPGFELRWRAPRDVAVLIDGHDLTRHLTGVRIDVDSRGFPQATLDLLAMDLDVATSHADVHLSDEATDALRAMGWTPPGELLTVTEHTSDGHHTFAELYRHRTALLAAFARDHLYQGWRTKEHHPDDSPMFAGYFLVQLDLPTGPVSYHVRLEHWDDFAALRTLPHAPRWEGHTPNDVVRSLVDHATRPDGIITTDAHITSIPADIEYRLRSALHREVHRLAPDPLTGNGTGYPLGILNAGHPDALAMARANLAYDDPEVAAHVAQWSDPTTDPTAIDDERARARDAADGLDDFRRVATRFTRRIADAFDVPPDRVTADPHLPGRWHTPDGTLEHHPVGAHAWYRASGGWTRHYWDPTPPDTDANPLRSACGAWEITPDQLRHAPDRRCCRHCLTVLTARYEGKKRRDQRQSG
jgi:hypothetical protein